MTEPKKVSIILNQIEELTKKPEKYLSVQENEAELLKILTKDIYNLSKKNENPKNKVKDTLEELVISGLDEEQIWQQVELQNNSICNNLVKDVAHLLAKKEGLDFPLKFDKKKKNSSNKKNKQNQETGNKNEEKPSKTIIKKMKPKKKKHSEVDDKFFNLQDMEEFLEKAEKGELDENDEEIDYFGSDLSSNEDDTDNDSDKNQLHYNDFFDKPDEDGEEEEGDQEEEEEEKTTNKTKKVKFSLNESEEEEENSEDDFDEMENADLLEEEENESEEDLSNNELESDEENENNRNKIDSEKEASSFEARQERLKQKIQNMEEEALKEKPWQLKGEVTATNRPQNSLLEEYVEFDIATRPAPVLTETSTLKLEDVIMQRIKDKAWDDVVRKFKPVDADMEYKKKLVLEQEKSKLSLSQIYEQEYLKQLDSQNENAIDKPEIEPPEHQEIRNMMNKLFFKLDALSNFHFTPKQVAPEVKIISNLPAINMEEVAPVAASDATLLAPEEIKPKSKGDLIGKSERTSTDKKRERRQKKLKQKIKFKQMEAKAKMKLEKSDLKGSKNAQNKISNKLLQKITKNSKITQLEPSEGGKYVKSSGVFFSKLQNETFNKTFKKGIDLKEKKSDKIGAKKRKTK